MHKVTKLAAGVAAAFAMTGSAMAINIGGLNVPTGLHIEVASVYENPIFAVGQELKGVGEVTSINGSAVGSLCVPVLTCELTYRFSGYIVSSLTATEVKFSGGKVEFYLQTGLPFLGDDFNPLTSASSAADLAAATNGTLFLTLKGHAVDALGNTLIASGANIGTGLDVGTGSGLLDVDTAAGGIANGNFNTDSIFALFGGGNADFQLGSSFSPLVVPHPAECAVGILDECLAGSADLRGRVIPEPGSLALLGLGLAGLGFATRRRWS